MRLESQDLTPTETTSQSGEGQTQQPIGALVHLGAGQCSELDEHLALRPQKLLLVEADPRLAASLQARTTKLANVQVVCQAVAGHPGPAIFHRYNLPGTSSLHPASGRGTRCIIRAHTRTAAGTAR